MKHIILLGDGMADWPIEELGNKTPLEYANTPYMDMLARMGKTGRLVTVPEGFPPGSEVANSSILGFNQSKVYEGRAPLEAASMGVDVQPGDLAIRCNTICIQDGKIKNHSAGHISSEEADELIEYLQDKLGNDKIRFYPGIQYRHLVIIKGGNKHIKCSPPHDHPGEEWQPLLVKAECTEAEETAQILNNLIIESQKLLTNHPVNQKRISDGKDPANSIWFWSGGYRPSMEPLTTTFPQIKSGAVVTAVDLIRGIGRYAGLRAIDVEGATGLYNTNYEGKAQAAIKALETDDFVFVHLEGIDEAGHEGNLKLKIQTIEDFDKRIVGAIYEATKINDEPVAFAVLPDHLTPIAVKTHVAEPVPFLIYYPGIEPDKVATYGERSCKDGCYGVMCNEQFIHEFLKN